MSTGADVVARCSARAVRPSPRRGEGLGLGVDVSLTPDAVGVPALVNEGPEVRSKLGTLHVAPAGCELAGRVAAGWPRRASAPRPRRARRGSAVCALHPDRQELVIAIRAGRVGGTCPVVHGTTASIALCVAGHGTSLSRDTDQRDTPSACRQYRQRITSQERGESCAGKQSVVALVVNCNHNPARLQIAAEPNRRKSRRKMDACAGYVVAHVQRRVSRPRVSSRRRSRC